MNSVVGVDISPDFLRAVEISREEDAYRLVAVGAEPTPENSIADGLVVDHRRMGRAIREMFRRHGFRARKVVTALRGPGTMARIINLPSLPHQRLKKLVESEIARYVAFGGAQKVFYYHPLEEFDEGDRRKVSVLVAAAKMDLCNSYYRAFREAGLDVVHMDLSPFCVMRVLRTAAPALGDAATMSVVFDYYGVYMNIFQGDVVRFLRTITLPGDQVFPSTDGFMDRLATEILMSIHYYQSEHAQGAGISRVVLTLGGSVDFEIYNQLSSSIPDIPLFLHAPFSSIKVRTEDFPPEVMEAVDYNFVPAVGLALWEQELEPLPFQVELFPDEISGAKTLLAEAKYLMLALLTAILALTLYTSGLRMQMKNLDDELRRQTTQSDFLNRFIENARRARPDSAGVETLKADGPVTPALTGVLEEIRNIIPSDVQLVSLGLSEPDGVVFEGVADSNPAIFYFLASLERSEMFRSPELGPRKKVNVGGHDMVSFTIQCRYVLP
ncbi:MAG: pilus assembly protein PilM [bacterium]